MNKRYISLLLGVLLVTLTPYAMAQGKFRLRPIHVKVPANTTSFRVPSPGMYPSNPMRVNPNFNAALRLKSMPAAATPAPTSVKLNNTWQAPIINTPTQSLSNTVQQRISAVDAQRYATPAPGTVSVGNNLPPVPPSDIKQVADLPEDDRPLTEVWGLDSMSLNELEQFDGRLLDISNDLQNIREFLAYGNQLTPRQFARVQAAENYFRSLTLEEVTDKKVWMSPAFRQHAAVLRSPQATEQAFFIEQNMYKESYRFDKIPQEAGYIPTFIGNEKGDLSYQSIREAFRHADKTSEPIFVKWTTHGELDEVGNFYFLLGDPGSTNRVYTKQVVEDLQLLRQVTGAPVINFQTDACHAGQFLEEFTTLPETMRQGINVFVLAGGRMQVNNQGVEAFNRVRNEKQTMPKQQLAYLLEHMGQTGNIFVRGYVNGQPFNPLEQAVERAQAENSPLYAKLEALQRIQNTGSVKETKSVLLDYQFDAHGSWFPSFMGDGFDTMCLFFGLELEIADYVHATGQKMLCGKPVYETLSEQWEIDPQAPQTHGERSLLLISDALEAAKQNIASLTPEQLQRVKNAENYFRSLSFAQAVLFDTQISALFRQHAAVLRSPTATEHAYYIQGYQYEHLYQNSDKAWDDLSEENGYIPTVIGNPKNGTTLADVNQVFANATPTDKSVFVQIAAHGNVDANGQFRLGLQTDAVSTEELITSIQRLRKQTGTPQVNVQLDSCLGGSCLMEFANLPANMREGINLFVLAGTHNYNYFDKETLMARSRGNKQNSMALNLTGVLLRNIAKGKILAGAYINGKPFLPITHLIQTKEPISFEMEKLYAIGLEQTEQGAISRQGIDNFSRAQDSLVKDKETYIRPVFNAALELGREFFGDAFDRMVAEENITLPEK